ncbi:MAG: helix-turn-helix transcriptional regulator, partial [Clostridia bacterium]|nr:helix-turn-helix transcriptional regulator [Clostridia bacterium]
VDNLRAERLKSMIKQEGKTQREFGKFPDGTQLSQQAISGILNGHNALTEATAKLIIRYYPEYRFEWLMGYDDYMTHADLEAHKQAQRDAYWRNVDDYTATIEQLIDLTVERINNHSKRNGKQIDNIDELGKAFLACQISDSVQMLIRNYNACKDNLDDLLTYNNALKFFRWGVHSMDKTTEKT